MGKQTNYNVPMATAVQLAKNELRNAYSDIVTKYGLAAYLLDGIFCELLCEIRTKEQSEAVSDTVRMFMTAETPPQNTTEEGGGSVPLPNEEAETNTAEDEEDTK